MIFKTFVTCNQISPFLLWILYYIELQLQQFSHPPFISLVSEGKRIVTVRIKHIEDESKWPYFSENVHGHYTFAIAIV